MIKVLDKKNSLEEWVTLFKIVGRSEPYCNPFYCDLFSNSYDEPICVYWEDKCGKIILPLIKRNIKNDIKIDIDPDICDLISPYGYGGPFYIGNPNWDEFWEEFFAWGKINKYISCFIRLSLFVPNNAVEKIFVRIRKKNIVRSLCFRREEIWKDYEHKVRKNVNRAIKENVIIKIDKEGNHLTEFVCIYNETMQRRSAEESYYFKNDFFEKLINMLKGNYVFFHAIYQDTIISSELALVSEENIYSFLGGTREIYFSLRPNDLLKHEIIMWGIENGKKNYIIGGGYLEDDGIYRYKKSFSPNGVMHFKSAEIIFDEQKYKDLLMMKDREGECKDNLERDNYFPAYRR